MAERGQGWGRTAGLVGSRVEARLRRLRRLGSGVAVLGAASVALVVSLSSAGAGAALTASADVATVTPIKHVVVIFDENVSFDHYFATYPKATNTDGQSFYAAPGTPSVNGLTGTLLSANPNGVNPVRLDPGNVNDVLTCSQNHGYTPEENAFDGGLMDKFTATNGTATTTGKDPEGVACNAPPEQSVVMDYYDGNTVTAMWNYAQHYAMSDNNFETTFGPSSPGATNLVSGNTGGIDTAHEVRSFASDVVADGLGGQSLIGDANPYWDDCSTGTSGTLALKGTNIGELLNAAGLSWGWFQGGFTPTTPYTGTVDTPSSYNQLAPDNTPVTCTSTSNVGAALGGTGTSGADPWGTNTNYVEHWEPFQFYASTANPHHLAPTSLGVVGTDTATPGEFNTANHNYDVSTFNSLISAIDAGSLPASNFPAVSYLKAPQYESGHPSSSDPIDEQEWLVSEVNAIESLPTWASTAIFVTYDDSDGDYDHVYPGVENPSKTVSDTLSAPGACGSEPPAPLLGEQGRCGFASRLPLLTISPCAKQNVVDHDLSDQASILNFIEYNWRLPSIPGSFDSALAKTDQAEGVPFDLAAMFDFSRCDAPTLLLDASTGELDLRNASDQGENLQGVNDSSAEATDADFQGSNLSDAFFEGADLQGATLQGANLGGANLSLVNLSGAQVSGANLQGANLQGANLTGANLTGANLQGVNLQGANLTGANLSGTVLTGANLHGATLGGVTWSDTTCPDATNSNSDGGSCTNNGAPFTVPAVTAATVTAATVTSATVTTGTTPTTPTAPNQPGADLQGDDLQGDNLQGDNLQDADLQGDNLQDANLRGDDLGNANLGGANLTGDSLQGDNLQGDSLQGDSLTDANLSGANLQSTDLTSANLTDANLTGANLQDANLTGANLTGANLTGANLTGAIWSNTTCPDATNSNADANSCVGHT